MGLGEFAKKIELSDIFRHSVGLITTMGLTNIVCDQIEKSKKLSDEQKKTYSVALRGMTMTGNVAFYVGEKFVNSKEDYTLFMKTVVTGLSAVVGGTLAGALSKYVSSQKADAQAAQSAQAAQANYTKS